ncbi:MAG: hypothetical protein QOI57_455 [Rubrobacteraceae bacterium]|nr:hypothetical protein [Rubrobacteraceae bacterium]
MGVGNDLRYTPTTCFETFPFPEPTEEQREEISAAAKRLDELRRNWLNPEGASEAELKKRTLTNLYNARPTWLANANTWLDAAVYAAVCFVRAADPPERLPQEAPGHWRRDCRIMLLVGLFSRVGRRICGAGSVELSRRGAPSKGGSIG